jgi:hypothetical protein
MVTVGLLTGLPVFVGAGAAAAASVSLAINKYFDDRRDVRLSDMYFLWIAARETRRH